MQEHKDMFCEKAGHRIMLAGSARIGFPVSSAQDFSKQEALGNIEEFLHWRKPGCMVCGAEAAQIQFILDVVAERAHDSVNGDAGAVGDAYHALEITGDTGGINQHFIAGCRPQLSSGLNQALLVATGESLGKFHQFTAELHAAVASIFLAIDDLQIDVCVGKFRAQTEHGGM